MLPERTNRRAGHEERGVLSPSLRRQIEEESTAGSVQPPERAPPRVVVDQSPAWDWRNGNRAFRSVHLFHYSSGAERGHRLIAPQIINARVDPAVSPNATISMFETKEDKVTVSGLRFGIVAFRVRGEVTSRCMPRFSVRNRSRGLIFSLNVSAVAQGTETVGRIVMANHVPDPTPIPAELNRLEETLNHLFGYNQSSDRPIAEKR